MHFSKNPLLDPWNPRWLRSAILKLDTTSAEGGPIWIKFRRLVQNDMSTAMIWSKSKPEFQYGERLGEFCGMPPQSHLPYYRMLPPGEFNVMIPELRVTLQGAVTWRNQCHDRATLQSVIISIRLSCKAQRTADNWTQLNRNELDRSVQFSFPAINRWRPSPVVAARRRFLSNDIHCVDWPIHKYVPIVKNSRRPPISSPNRRRSSAVQFPAEHWA